MLKPIEHVEIITGIQDRRRYTAEEKVRLVEQIKQPGITVSAIARLLPEPEITTAALAVRLFTGERIVLFDTCDADECAESRIHQRRAWRQMLLPARYWPNTAR
jgi:hypothetical protein